MGEVRHLLGFLLVSGFYGRTPSRNQIRLKRLMVELLTTHQTECSIVKLNKK